MLDEDLFNDIMVMIVDDQSTMRKIVRHLLFQIGKFDVVEASNGLRALEILYDKSRDKMPDVIISDLHMDGMDGNELCNLMRLSKIPSIREIPVIMLTGENDNFILNISKQLGVFKILKKPVAALELKNNISAALGFNF